MSVWEQQARVQPMHGALLQAGYAGAGQNGYALRWASNALESSHSSDPPFSTLSLFLWLTLEVDLTFFITDCNEVGRK